MKAIIALLFIVSTIFLKGIFSIVFLDIDSPYETLLFLKIITISALCGLSILALVLLKKIQKQRREAEEDF